MNIIITTKNLDNSPALNNFIRKKFSGLKKYINILKKDEVKNTLAQVYVEVEKETKHHKKGEIFLIKTRVVLPKKKIVAICKESDVFKAVVDAKDAMKLEVEKYKFKRIDKNRRTERKLKGVVY